MGDKIGVTAVNGVAYAVWTDTRNGTQQIYLQKYSLSTPPQAPLDRFYPNNTPPLATALGAVTSEDTVPLLSTGPADDNWFNFQGGDAGTLILDANVTSGDAATFQIELTDANGNVLPAAETPILSASGTLVGYHLTFTSVAGQTYLIHVSDKSTTGYTLSMSDLTADIGTAVFGNQTGAIVSGGQAAYHIRAAVTGTMELTLTPGEDAQGELVLLVATDANSNVQQLLDESGAASAGAPQTISIPVNQGQDLVLLVVAADENSSGSFTLQYTNLDQASTPGQPSTFLPTAGDPSSVVVANLQGNSTPDILVTNTDASDTLQVLAGNANGTFQAARQFQVGPGLSGVLTAGVRQIGIADLNGDGLPDVIVPNFRAADISVLIGNGDSTFQPQRNFDAVPSPDALVTADFNGDGKADIAVLQNFPQLGGTSKIAIMMGRGDGTFKPAVTLTTDFTNGAGPMVVGDFTGNGHNDIIVFSKNAPVGEIFLGNGDGTFREGGVFSTGENVFAAEAIDVGGPGLSLITTGTNSGNVYILQGNGDGTFQAAFPFPAAPPVRAGVDVGVFGMAIVGFNSTVAGSPGPDGLTMVSGTPGIYVAAQARSGAGTGEVVFLPAVFEDGIFEGFDAPQPVATLSAAGKIVAFNDNGQTDLAATDTGGVLVVNNVNPLPGSSDADTSGSGTAAPIHVTDLGNVPHVVMPAQSITPGHEDAFFTYNVPVESSSASGDQVIDFSALFQFVNGAGLQMEVTDASGNVLGSGDRFRIVAAQGAALTVHIFGLKADGVAQGTGAYTLDIDVLPQVVSVNASPTIPGGPVTSIVLTLQGDLLDPSVAEDPNNYTVAYLGPNGDQVIPVSSTSGSQPVVYDPSANVDVTSGLSYPTASRQTITLVFASPLPAGSYRITLSPNIQAAPFDPSEVGSLAGDASFAGHPIVSQALGVVKNGATIVGQNLVGPTAATGAVNIAQGTPFLSQLQSDLAAMLNEEIRDGGDDPNITANLNAEIMARFNALFAPFGPTDSKTPVPFQSLTIIWLDPVSIGLQSSQGLGLSYSLATNQVSNGLGGSFVSVGGNVEMIVMENAAGTFNLNVANVPSEARGGEVELSTTGVESVDLTTAMQAQQTSFQLALGGESGAVPGGEGGAPPEGAGALAGALSNSASLSLLSTALLVGPLSTSESSSSANSEAAAEAAATASDLANRDRPHSPAPLRPFLAIERRRRRPGQRPGQPVRDQHPPDSRSIGLRRDERLPVQGQRQARRDAG